MCYGVYAILSGQQLKHNDGIVFPFHETGKYLFNSAPAPAFSFPFLFRVCFSRSPLCPLDLGRPKIGDLQEVGKWNSVRQV